MIKVFLSHHSSDSAAAVQISNHLRNKHGIDSYLDVIDNQIGRNGEELADYLRAKMGGCTNLMALVSAATKSSQWVPWEIGVASERDMPLATFLNGIAVVPEFLLAWPRLQTLQDVDDYAAASRTSESTVLRKRASRIDETASLKAGRADFYSDIRKRLNQ